jgi:hypothetical protein
MSGSSSSHCPGYHATGVNSGDFRAAISKIGRSRARQTVTICNGGPAMSRCESLLGALGCEKGDIAYQEQFGRASCATRKVGRRVGERPFEDDAAGPTRRRPRHNARASVKAPSTSKIIEHLTIDL